jgi:tripartite-type tricarboxylate transporter receptor subunit TctC
MRSRIKAPTLAAFVLGCLAAFTQPARAQQAWPSRAITLVVPFAAGGATDILGRLLGQGLSTRLGQPVVVENRPGAGGGVGATAVAKASPDGYTLLLGAVSTHAINPTLYKSLGYDAAKDFVPIAYVAGVPNLLVVSPKRVAAKSVAELLTEIAARPAGFDFASAGNGTSIHLSGEMFKVASGLKLTHVPYRGSAPAVGDLMSGNVDLMFDNLPSALQLARNGDLRALAVTSARRSPTLPEIPTMAESGFPHFVAESWFVLFAPAGTPAAVTERLTREATGVLESPDFNARLATLGASPRALTGAALSAFIAEETAKWGEVVRKSGARAD